MNPYMVIRKGTLWIIWNIAKRISIGEFYDKNCAMNYARMLNVIAK